MRLLVEMETQKSLLPKDHRRCFISVLKKGLTDYEDGKYFDELFGKGEEKQYCFAIRLPKGTRYEGDFAILPESKVWMTISTADTRTGIILNNALLKVTGESHPLPDGNELKITKLYPAAEPFVNEDKVAIQFLAPVCLREHHKTGDVKDIYHTISEPEFESHFTASVDRQMGFAAGVSIVPIQMHEVYVKHYGVYIPCSLGTAVLAGDKATLQHLAMSGVGSRRGGGFGLFRILSNEEVQELCKKFA